MQSYIETSVYRLYFIEKPRYRFTMMLITTILAATIITARNVIGYTNDTYYKLCGEKDLFIKQPKTFPLTKPSCYWNM